MAKEQGVYDKLIVLVVNRPIAPCRSFTTVCTWEHVYFRILIGKQSVKVGVTRIIIE